MPHQPERRHRRPDVELRQQRRELERQWNEVVVARIRGEFLEMPGLRLTAEQVQRLCGVEQTICRLVLESLVDGGFLCRTPDGAYARAIDGEIPHPHPTDTELNRANDRRTN